MGRIAAAGIRRRHCGDCNHAGMRKTPFTVDRGHAGGDASLRCSGRVLHLLQPGRKCRELRRRIDGKCGLDTVDTGAKTGLSGARRVKFLPE